MKLMLVTSGGGHLTHLLWYKQLWAEHERCWVVLPGADVSSRLVGERTIDAFGPSNRSLKNAIRNTGLATRLVKREQPDWIITAGAGVAVPFVLVGRSQGIKTMFMEVCDRLQRPSLTGRMVRGWVDQTIIFDAQQRAHYPSAVLLKGAC